MRLHGLAHADNLEPNGLALAVAVEPQDQVGTPSHVLLEVLAHVLQVLTGCLCDRRFKEVDRIGRAPAPVRFGEVHLEQVANH